MSSRELSLVLMDGKHFVAELSDYPVIPPAGHIFTFKRSGRRTPYRVIETQSIIDLDEAQNPNVEPGPEAIRVDVELAH